MDEETEAEEATPAATAQPSARSTYNGEIDPAQTVAILGEVAGMALEVNAGVGDMVKMGDVLVIVESSTLEAQRQQALAALDAAQAQLDLLDIKAEPEDVEAARAAVAAASAAYQRALDGPTEEDLRAAEAQLRQAEAAVTQAQAAYNQVRGNPNVGALPQSLQLQQATLQVEAAQAQYDKIVKGSTEDVIAGAYSQLAQARAQLARLQADPQDAQVRAAQAQVQQAETSLYLAQLQLDKATVRAPVDGAAARINVDPGSMVAPGANLMTLVSEDVRVTIQVEETRLPQLGIGQRASIRVNAYPDRAFAAEIINIAPTLNASTRTVEVSLRPTDDTEHLLAPGMFATVTLE